MSRKSSGLKEDKPVNISISFNIAPNEIIKTQKDKPGQLRGRKIRNSQTLKSNRDTPLHGSYAFKQEDLTERETFAREEPRPEDFKKKRKIKRQSMDGIFESRPAPDKLFISCENNKIFEKPQVPQVKLTPMMSTRRKQKYSKPKTARPSCAPTSTKSENLKSGRIESSILKSVMGNSEKEKLSLKNLKDMISKLVTEELRKQQPLQRTNKSMNIARPVARQPRKLKVERKKGNEVAKKAENKKRSVSKQSMREDALKLNSLKLINDSSLIKSDSDKQAPQNATAPLLVGLAQIAATVLKTSASNANLRDMVRVKYPEEAVIREYTSVEEHMATKIQRYWREYRTKKIVKQYIEILRESEGFEEMQEMVRGQRHIDDDEDTNQEVERPQYPIADYLLERPEDVSEIIAEFTQVKEVKVAEQSSKSPEPLSDKKGIRQFHSFQLGKEQQPAQAMQFKRKQISKWDQTLEFITKNLNNSDIKGILLQVAQQLQLNKTLLQKEISGQKKNGKDNDLASFTIPLNSKKDPNESYDEFEKQINELAQSYVSEQPNEQLNQINFKSLHSALNNRKKALELKEARQLQILEDKFQAGKVTKQIYQKERQRLARWIKYEETQIKKAKQHLDKGLNKAKHIIEKNTGDKEFFKKLTDGGIKKCLSESSFRQFRSKKKGKERVQIDYDEEEQEQQGHFLKRSSQELSAKRLKEKLKNLNDKNVSNSPDISYEELSHQYNEDDEFGKDQLEEANIIKNQLKVISAQPKKQSSQKFEDLQDSDREDIFEFIFLDLLIEFCQQVVEQSRTPLVADYFTKAKKPPVKRNKGIKTNITIVKDYLKKFMGFLSRTNLVVMERVGIPMGPSALEMLKYMHYNQDDADQQEEDLMGTLVLPTNTFEVFENNLLAGIEFEAYYDDPKRQNDRIEFLKGVIHIHNKAIFDSLNESLDLQRPFGIWGKPFPWKRVPQFSHKLTREQVQSKFKQSTDRVIQNCTYVCGIIIDKEDSLVTPGTRLSQDYIEQIKEDRLSRMLASDLIENEERWVFYDDEETEVLVEISHLIYQLMLKEGCKDILSIARS